MTEPKPETDTPEHEAAESDAFEAEENKAATTIAKDYMVPMSDSALKEWKDKDGFAEYCSEIASGLFPTLAPRLALGLTTKVLLDPYIEIGKQLIGKDFKPDWQDPIWAKALTGGMDDKTKSPTVMPLGEWENYIKTTPGTGYENTDAAKSQAQGFVDHMNSGADTWDGAPEAPEGEQ